MSALTLMCTTLDTWRGPDGRVHMIMIGRKTFCGVEAARIDEPVAFVGVCDLCTSAAIAATGAEHRCGPWCRPADNTEPALPGPLLTPYGDPMPEWAVRLVRRLPRMPRESAMPWWRRHFTPLAIPGSAEVLFLPRAAGDVRCGHREFDREADGRCPACGYRGSLREVTAFRRRRR